MSAENSDQIVTSGDFQRFLDVLATKEGPAFDASLELYLRSLWGLVQREQQTPVSWRLLGELLADAFTSEPVPFDEGWLMTHVSPPSLEEPELTEHGYERLQQMILYQIADLRRMATNGSLYDPLRYFGIESPTKYHWYNFEPESFLGCAASAIDPDEKNTDCGWGDLAVVLWLGQIYE